MRARWTSCCATMRDHLVVFLATMAAAVVLYATVPTGFFPQQDTGFLSGVVMTSQDASFAKMRDKIARSRRRHQRRIPASPASACSSADRRRQPGQHFNISLKPKDSGRKANADQVITRLRPKLAQLVGVQTFLQAAQDINVGGRAGQAQYQYTLSDSDLTSSTPGRRSCSPRMQALPQLKDVSSDQQSNGRRGQSDHRPRRGRALRHRAGRHRRGDLRPDRPATRSPSISPS